MSGDRLVTESLNKYNKGTLHLRTLEVALHSCPENDKSYHCSHAANPHSKTLRVDGWPCFKASKTKHALMSKGYFPQVCLLVNPLPCIFLPNYSIGKVNHPLLIVPNKDNNASFSNDPIGLLLIIIIQ